MATESHSEFMCGMLRATLQRVIDLLDDGDATAALAVAKRAIEESDIAMIDHLNDLVERDRSWRERRGGHRNGTGPGPGKGVALLCASVAKTGTYISMRLAQTMASRPRDTRNDPPGALGGSFHWRGQLAPGRTERIAIAAAICRR